MMEDIAVIDIVVPPPTVVEVMAGTKGDPGPPGPAGAPGGSSSVFFYKIDANATGQSDPGTGKLRYNHATQNLATALYVDWITDDGFDAHQFFLRTAATTHVVIQDADLAVNYQEWELTGSPINYPDWFEVPVRFVASSGAAQFTHNTRIAALLITESNPLPTAPIGQVLTSQGDGVPPVFNHSFVLHNPNGLVNQRTWKFFIDNAGLNIRMQDDAGNLSTPYMQIDCYGGSVSSIYGSFAAYNGCVNTKWIAPLPTTYDVARSNASMSPAGTAGNLANISDSTTNVTGAVINGGGTFIVFARWNGSNWIVISG